MIFSLILAPNLVPVGGGPRSHVFDLFSTLGRLGAKMPPRSPPRAPRTPQGDQKCPKKVPKEPQNVSTFL